MSTVRVSRNHTEGRCSVGIRLSGKARAQLAQLSKEWGISQAAVVEILLRQAERDGIAHLMASPQ